MEGSRRRSTDLRLSENPFQVLGVALDTDIESLTNTYEDALDDHVIDERVLASAYQALSAPARRLTAELSWLPGVALDAIRQVLAGSLPDDAGSWSAIARINAAFELFMVEPDLARASAVLQAWQGYDEQATLAMLNELRTRAGLPAITEAAIAKERIALRERQFDVMSTFVAAEAGGPDWLTSLVDPEREGDAQNEVLLAMLERYEALLLPRLSARSERLVEILSSLSGMDSAQAEAAVAQAQDEIAAWATEIAPLHCLDLARGLEERHTAGLLDAIEDAVDDMSRDDAQTIDPTRIKPVLDAFVTHLAAITGAAERAMVIGLKVEADSAMKAARAQEPRLAGMIDAVRGDFEAFARSAAQGQFRTDGDGMAGQVFAELEAALARQEAPDVRNGLWTMALSLVVTTEASPGGGTRAALLMVDTSQPLLERYSPRDEERQTIEVVFLQVRQAELALRIQAALEREDKDAALRAVDQLIVLTPEGEDRENLRQVREQIRNATTSGMRTLYLMLGIIVLVINFFLLMR